MFTVKRYPYHVHTVVVLVTDPSTRLPTTACGRDRREYQWLTIKALPTVSVAPEKRARGHRIIALLRLEDKSDSDYTVTQWKIRGSIPLCAVGFLSVSNHTSNLKIGSPVATP